MLYTRFNNIKAILVKNFVFVFNGENAYWFRWATLFIILFKYRSIKLKMTETAHHVQDDKTDEENFIAKVRINKN